MKNQTKLGGPINLQTLKLAFGSLLCEDSLLVAKLYVHPVGSYRGDIFALPTHRLKLNLQSPRCNVRYIYVALG